jgi:hypothetical protein
METEIKPTGAVIVEIAGKRAPIAALVGTVDAALASEITELTVRVVLTEQDSRRGVLERLYGADSRVAIADPGASAPAADILFTVPGRFASRLGRGGKLRASAGGSRTNRLRAVEAGLRSATSRKDPGPPPPGTLAEERAEHLRHRARSSTMRARMDRNAHRLSRERLQVRHEQARLRLAERRLGKTGAGKWVRWRSRVAARQAAAIPALARSGARSVRVFGRRARRFALDRWRSRGSEPA